MNVSAIVAEIQASSVQIGAVGIAVLLLLVAGKLWRWVSASLHD